MNTGVLVSVVTPCRNSAPFIEHCIASVLNQDYPHVQHVVQDAASTDGTLAVLRKYDGRVDWLSQPDNGQSDGLNRALQRCRGEIIGVLNADDEYLPGAVSWAVDQLERHPEVAVVYGDKCNIDATGRVLSVSRGPHPYRFDRLFCVEDVPPAQAAFIRRSYFEQVGFYADTTRQTCPDYEMWVRIGLKFPMRYSPGFVARYREHPGSETHQCHMIDLAVQSRLEVIERTIRDPATPDRVKALRKRAVAGAYLWAAVAKRDVCSHRPEVLNYLRRAALANPGPRTCLRLARFLLASVTPSRFREALAYGHGTELVRSR